MNNTVENTLPNTVVIDGVKYTKEDLEKTTRIVQYLMEQGELFTQNTDAAPDASGSASNSAERSDGIPRAGPNSAAPLPTHRVAQSETVTSDDAFSHTYIQEESIIDHASNNNNRVGGSAFIPPQHNTSFTGTTVGRGTYISANSNNGNDPGHVSPAALLVMQRAAKVEHQKKLFAHLEMDEASARQRGKGSAAAAHRTTKARNSSSSIMSLD